MPTTSPQPGTAGRRFGVRTILLASSFVLVGVPFLLILLLVLGKSANLLTVDDGARDSLHSYAVDHPLFVTLMQVVSYSGSTPAWIGVFTLVALWLLWRRLPRLAAFAALTPLLSSLLNNAVKNLVHRTRPVLPDPVEHAAGQSFPSGHAQAAIVGYGVLILLFMPALRGVWRRVAVVLAVLMVISIGFSRVALGVHYVSDVLAGYILGAAWLVAMTAAFSAWRRERGLPPVRPEQGLAPEEAEALTPHATNTPTDRTPQ